MKIGLIDVDNIGKEPNFPNLALMKLSAYHKMIGHEVEMVNPFLTYDKVYMSKVFDFTRDFDTIVMADEIIKNGVGYGVENDRPLPSYIEHIMPDYSLYGIKDTAYGFMTRGCPRNCDFCNVSQHQGKKSVKVANLSQFWDGQKTIKLLDPNTLACEDWREVFQQLIDSKAYIDFTQGVDIRLMTEEKAKMIKKMKIKMIHFAWDGMDNSDHIIKKLNMFMKVTKFNKSKVRVYVLTNFNTTHQQDLFRIYGLRSMGIDPYVMIYDKDKLPQGHITKRIQRWVNNIYIWRKCDDFNDYKA